MIVYEQPISERFRLLLRLEELVRRFDNHAEREETFDTLVCMELLVQMYNLCARIDLKSDLIKELDRIKQAGFADNYSNEKVAANLAKLDEHADQLVQQRGQLGQHLSTHTFFNVIRQRAMLPGGLNGADVPVLQYWLAQPLAARKEDLSAWSMPFTRTATIACFVLDIIRENTDYTTETAHDGFFQNAFKNHFTPQFIQVGISDDSTIHPKISVGKQRFSIRFVDSEDLMDRGKQVSEAIEFKLRLCSL